MTKNILSLIGGVSLEVQLSLDGPRDIHDLIRGCIGSFAKVIESYEVLKSLKKHFPNLRINVAVTITNKNIQYLGKLKDYIQGNMSLVDSVFWGFWRDSARDSDIFLPEGKDLEDLQKINNSCQSSFVSAVLSDLFFNMKIKLIKSKKQIVDCAAGRLIGVIDNDGDVRFCETLAPIGNLKESSFIDIWHGEKAEGLRKKIKEQKCYCTHECFLAPSTLYNPGNYYKIIPELFCSLGRSRVRSRGQKMREQ
jgi:MoaA/NifB/PqqE/SkfB family radical SAM enzyme